jgi:indolepyruvate ferredoxin oxidoreductase
MERELIGWYEAHVEAALPKLSAENHAALTKAFALPMQIRGFGPVKEEAVRRVREEFEAARAVRAS